MPGEEQLFRDTQHQRSQDLSDREIDERYGSGEVRIVTEQARYPLPAIPEMVDSDDYDLNPDFQRRHRWSDERRSRLIESFIINVPIPPIFLYEDSYGHYEVMDGLQRLSAIRDFYRGNFALQGLEEWPSLNGRRYSQLPEQLRRGVDRRYLSSIILLQETAKSAEEAGRLKQLVFERINSGGEKLTAQESRNAVYAGPLNRACIKLSRDIHLCETWGIPRPTPYELAHDSPAPDARYRRMEDVELVLRFFAYRQQLAYQAGRPLKVFLDDYLQRGNKMPGKLLDELSRLFRDTIELVHKVLGHEAFMLWRPDSHGHFRFERRPTLAAYDPIMWAFGQHISDAELLRRSAATTRAALKEYYEANVESFSGRTANPADMRRRNVDLTNLLGRIIAQ